MVKIIIPEKHIIGSQKDILGVREFVKFIEDQLDPILLKDIFIYLKKSLEENPNLINRVFGLSTDYIKKRLDSVHNVQKEYYQQSGFLIPIVFKEFFNFVFLISKELTQKLKNSSVANIPASRLKLPFPAVLFILPKNFGFHSDDIEYETDREEVLSGRLEKLELVYFYAYMKEIDKSYFKNNLINIKHTIKSDMINFLEGVNQILEIPIPKRPKTTIVFNSIEGGTGKFSKIPKLSFLRFEIRSESDDMVHEIYQRIEDITTDVSYRYGDDISLTIYSKRRPGGIEFSHPLTKNVRSIMKYLNIKPRISPSTSELSAFIDQKIPAITLGITKGDRVDDEKEIIEIEPIYTGLAQLVALLLAIDRGQCVDDK